jgi:hypothetical protein
MKKTADTQGDEAIADLLESVVKQYRTQIRSDDGDAVSMRLEVVRKLDLIRQSIRGLMKPRQRGMEGEAAGSAKVNGESRKHEN